MYNKLVLKKVNYLTIISILRTGKATNPFFKLKIPFDSFNKSISIILLTIMLTFKFIAYNPI